MQRYEEFSEIIKVTQGKRRYATLYYPILEQKTSDVYIITKANHRLDLLAYQYYGDTRYWPIIAKANKLHAGTMRVPSGIRLRIPFPFNQGEFSDRFRDKQF